MCKGSYAFVISMLLHVPNISQSVGFLWHWLKNRFICYRIGGNQLTLNAPPPPPGTPALTPRKVPSGSGKGSSSSGFPMGAIIGVAVGGVVLLAALALVLWFCCKKKRGGKKLDDAEANRNSSRRTWFTPLIAGKGQNSQHLESRQFNHLFNKCRVKPSINFSPYG